MINLLYAILVILATPVFIILLVAFIYIVYKCWKYLQKAYSSFLSWDFNPTTSYYNTGTTHYNTDIKITPYDPKKSTTYNSMPPKKEPPRPYFFCKSGGEESNTLGDFEEQYLDNWSLKEWKAKRDK